MITALACDEAERPAADLDRDDALHAPVGDHQVDAEVLVQALDRRVLHRRLEQRVQHGKPDLSAANQVRSIFMPPKARTLT